MTEQIDFTAPKFDGDGPVAPLASNVRFGISDGDRREMRRLIQSRASHRK